MKTCWDWFLASGMLLTGSVNTISTKLADMQNATGQCTPNGTLSIHGSPNAALDGTCPERAFNHPFTQTTFMFLGELMCLVTFKMMLCGICGMAQKRRSTTLKQEAQPFSPFIFLLPACCDMTATSCMYVGLTMTYASVFQMLRGSVVIFTGILSVVFLKRKLYVFHWLGMICVLIGATLVGVASVMDSGSNTTHVAHPPSNPLVGDILIVGAQIIVAVQMVVEEKLVVGKNVPALQAVGWEGFWGFLVLSCLLVAMYYMPALDGLSDGPKLSDTDNVTNYPGAGEHFENSIDAFMMMGQNPVLLVSVLLNVASIAFFNFFGISVTKAMSASHRMVLDSVRTIIIWAVGLVAFGESFAPLQLVGFVILLLGTGFFNELIRLPCLKKYHDELRDATEKEREGASGMDAYSALPNNYDGDGQDATVEDFFSPHMSKWTVKD